VNAEQLNPDFAVSERNSALGGQFLHRVKALLLLLHSDEHGFAADFCQLDEMKQS